MNFDILQDLAKIDYPQNIVWLYSKYFLQGLCHHNDLLLSNFYIYFLTYFYPPTTFTILKIGQKKLLRPIILGDKSQSSQLQSLHQYLLPYSNEPFKNFVNCFKRFEFRLQNSPKSKRIWVLSRAEFLSHHVRIPSTFQPQDGPMNQDILN